MAKNREDLRNLIEEILLDNVSLFDDVSELADVITERLDEEGYLEDINLDDAYSDD